MYQIKRIGDYKMEIRYWKCEKCGRTSYDLQNFYTIKRKYIQRHYDMGECYKATDEEDVHHICIECFKSLKQIILNK